MNRRAILVVLDGLGIGEMPDVTRFRPQDAGANTLAHILERSPGLRLPVLEAMGLGNVVRATGLRPAGPAALSSYGRCMLGHEGADTYAGHNEIAGSSPPRSARMLFSEVSARVRSVLESRGYRVAAVPAGGPALVVEDAVLVGDNLEADPGAVFNVTAALDAIPFETVLAIARAVRGEVPVSRVIALGGPRITIHDIVNEVRSTASGQTGVVTPNLNIYNEQYQVRHMGYGVNPGRQAPGLAARAGIPVTLIGKMADVIDCPGAHAVPCVPTREVLHHVLEEMDRIEDGLIAATVQETDLAGHEKDTARYAQVLMTADELIGRILACLAARDLFVVAADHGNDPTIIHRSHTREMVPLLALYRAQPARDLGLRRTLSDIGATISEYLGTGPTETGESFLSMLGG
ncbi:MAG: phosphopentomutase [Firmicutes bacterium]|nr:phosphopentomutase [Bacillota bacterium]